MSLEEKYSTSSSNNNNNNTNASASAGTPDNEAPKRKRKRWGAVEPVVKALPDAKARLLAQQESIRARLAAAKARVLVGGGQQQQQQQQLQSSSKTTTTTTTVTTAIHSNIYVPTNNNSTQHLQASLPSSQQQQSLTTPADSSIITATNNNNNNSKKRSYEEDLLNYNKQAKHAKVYDLDLTITGPTYKQQQLQEQQQQQSTSAVDNNKVTLEEQPINPYLAHHHNQLNDSIADTFKKLDDDDVIDDRLVRTSKPRVRNKALTFVEPGKWQDRADRQRAKTSQAQLYLSGRKVGHSVSALGMADVYGPNSDAEIATDIPDLAQVQEKNTGPLILEWWDMELLPSKLRKQVATAESDQWNKTSKAAIQKLDLDNNDDGGNDQSNNTDKFAALRDQCFAQFSLSNSKTATLVQHIVPIKPPNASNATASQQQPTLYLTKKEQKRQRKLRRQEKQRELQDLQAAGLIPAPEPRLTLKNFIQVMGDQAYLDPSQIEKKVQEQMQARQTAHFERNQKQKLTREQRAAKRAAKLRQEDTTTQGSVSVALFWVKDMSHPYHRAKVDLNAQQNYITGGVIECKSSNSSVDQPSLTCVICEGGPKAIKRFKRLMLVRMSWTGPKDGLDDEDDSSEDEEPIDGVDNDGSIVKNRKFNPDNKCELVWQGMSTKRFFNGFVFQSVETVSQAKKILQAKGVGHYWDQVLQHAQGVNKGFQLRLAAEDSDDDNPYKSNEKEENDDNVMEE